MYLLNELLMFPDPSEADEEGLLAIGGDLSSDRLLLAYQSGVFPWYDEQQPILWWSPDPRMILFPSKFKVSKSLSKTIKNTKFKITFNTSFSEVIKNCSTIKREGQGGTWITQEMEEAYVELHKLGHAQSVEVWNQDALVGGLYGINLPKQKIFCGESMFSTQTDASKVGFYYLVKHLQQKNYKLIDCQMHTDHLESLGAEEITRELFIQHLTS
jgi:leucyl/phenylalanyl-tRNA--protein transferase